LKDLLQTLQKDNERRPKQKPILLKIAPDLTESQLDDIIEIVQETKIAGVIATNTTISRRLTVF
jgi:dihydroorotate dehydrogenase